MRAVNTALAVESLSFTAFLIICSVAAEEMPTQSQVARRLRWRYWLVKNEVDNSPWIIKHRQDLIRLSLTPDGFAKACRIKATLNRLNPPTP